jgi:osmotically-inducible protein OsmY
MLKEEGKADRVLPGGKLMALLIALAAPALLSGCLSAMVGAVATGGVVAAQERSVGDAVDDLTIRAELNDLFFRKDIDLYRDVDFTVTEGRVLLTGSVKKPEDRITANQLAWRATGVRVVLNEIQVTDKGGIVDYGKDVWISTQLRTRLLFAKNVLSINYSVETVNGVVYLMGIAQDQAEIDRVIAIARDVPDVAQVVNHVMLKNDPERVKTP